MMSDPVEVVSGLFNGTKSQIDTILNTAKGNIDSALELLRIGVNEQMLILKSQIPSGPPVLLYAPMSAYNVPSPQVVTVSAEYGGREGWHLFRDNPVWPGWDPEQHWPQWCKIDIGVPREISHYNVFDLRWGYDANGDLVIQGYSLAAWTLEGSLLDDEYTLIDSIADIFPSHPLTGTPSTGLGAGDGKALPTFPGYGKAVSGSYRYFRFTQTSAGPPKDGWPFADAMCGLGLYGPVGPA
jgi:hypothetical protein